MNLESLRQKLLAAARSQPPADRVPYAFEQRVLARLERPPLGDVVADWAQALWRAAAPCLAIALLLSIWSFVATQGLLTHANGAQPEDLAQHFEQTMLAAVTADEPAEDAW
jgi:hypothetical protein